MADQNAPKIVILRAYHDEVVDDVLCKWGKEFVVWYFNKQTNGYGCGAYFGGTAEDLAGALECFNARQESVKGD